MGDAKQQLGMGDCTTKNERVVAESSIARRFAIYHRGVWMQSS